MCNLLGSVVSPNVLIIINNSFFDDSIFLIIF
nr:MAG TPA: hypothetical protein [Caudoviricetes sp.]DAN39421.1 MAG TPA: hypothetical protein [Caudoviricetes sp.]